MGSSMSEFVCLEGAPRWPQPHLRVFRKPFIRHQMGIFFQLPRIVRPKALPMCAKFVIEVLHGNKA
jgi:hypothetical protein